MLGSSEILFVSNRDTGTSRAEIYGMDKNGGNIIRITSSEYHHFIMGVDSTRRFLLCSRAEADTNSNGELDDGDRRSLWVIDLVTEDETRLTDPANEAEGDSFSPDGTWVVFFMKISGSPNSDIYKIKRDGTELTKLTDTSAAVEFDPCWSHDGATIVFTYIDEATPRLVLKTMDPDGTNIQTIYDGGAGISIPGAFVDGNYDPSWSFDDQWIVFERAVEYTVGDPENFGSGIWHVFKVRPDGTGISDLSSAGGHDDRAEFLPSFSPDNQQIVYGSVYQADPLENSHNDIFTMNADGSSPMRLTSDPANDMYPIWIPAED